MRKLRLFFLVLICIVTVVYSVEAHNKSVYLENTWTNYTNWRGHLNAGVTQLNKLNSKMNDLKGEWDDNNEDIRAGGLSLLGSIGDASVASFISAAAEIGLDLDESQSLESALDDAISKLESFYTFVKNVETWRNGAYFNLVYLIDQHNAKHGKYHQYYNYKKPTRIFWKISIDRYYYPCVGGCSITMDSPGEARVDHKVVCGGDKDPNPSVGGCGRSYYRCKDKDVKKHRVKYCDSYITWWPLVFHFRSV